MSDRPTPDPDPAELERVAALLAAQTWVFARTMPKDPHWYTFRWNWADDQAFLEVVAFIHRHGFVHHYRGRPYTCCVIGGYRYWTMGKFRQQTTPEDHKRYTTIINRVPVPDPDDPLI